MRLITLLLVLFSASVVRAESYAYFGTPDDRQFIEPAQKVAETFLAHFDANRLRAAASMSYTDYRAAKIKKQTPYPMVPLYQIEWRKTENKPFGKFEGRELVQVQVANDYPPLVDAKFVTFIYKATFAQKAAATQTVSLRFGQNKWEIIAFW